MTRDNMKKRGLKKPEDCVFCTCQESINHLFFDCVVAKEIWNTASSLLGRPLGGSLGSIASLWVAGKPLDHVNTACASIPWAIWKHRNNMIFNGVHWLSVNQVWWMVLRLVKKWRIIFKDHMVSLMDDFGLKLQQMIDQPFQLSWG